MIQVLKRVGDCCCRVNEDVVPTSGGLFSEKGEEARRRVGGNPQRGSRELQL